jgi:hypothetical protein
MSSGIPSVHNYAKICYFRTTVEFALHSAEFGGIRIPLLLLWWGAPKALTGAMEAHPGVVKAHPGVMEAHHGATEVHLGVLKIVSRSQ